MKPNLYCCTFTKGDETTRIIVTANTPHEANDYAAPIVAEEWKGAWTFRSAEPITAFLVRESRSVAVPFDEGTETGHKAAQAAY